MIPPPVPRDQHDGTAQPSSVLMHPRDGARASGASAQDVLTTIGETIYEWDLTSDRIRWGANAAEVLGVSDMRALSTGGAFGSLLHPDSVTDRHQAVLNGVGVDYGAGVPFDVTYAIRLQTEAGLQTVWLQDRGVWFADSEGAPYLARGVVRLCGNTVGRGGGSSPVRELPRRGAFLRMVNNILAMAAHYRTGHAVVALSVDNLALVARSYGVPAIEEMEAAIAERIRAVVRGGDLVGWLGECELGLVLAIGDDREATQAVERIVKAVTEQPVMTSAGPVSPLVIAGVVIAPFQASTLLQCLSRARAAQAEARIRGSGHYAFFHGEQAGTEAALSEVDIAVIVGRALADGGVKLVAHPVARASDGSEAFLICRPEFGAGASPVVGWAEAAAVAGSLGLGRSIDRSVIALATEFLARDASVVVQVPVLGESLRAESFATDVLRKLAAADVDPSRLILDIAEPELHSDFDALMPVVKSLRAKGCGFSIAEYGASFSSARILNAVGARWVRIDRDIARPSERLDSGAYFASVIKGARELGAEVVAPVGMSAEEAAALGADLLVVPEGVVPGNRRAPKRPGALKPRIRGRKVA